MSHSPDVSHEGAVGANKAGVALAFVSWIKNRCLMQINMKWHDEARWREYGALQS